LKLGSDLQYDVLKLAFDKFISEHGHVHPEKAHGKIHRIFHNFRGSNKQHCSDDRTVTFITPDEQQIKISFRFGEARLTHNDYLYRYGNDEDIEALSLLVDRLNGLSKFLAQNITLKGKSIPFTKLDDFKKLANQVVSQHKSAVIDADERSNRRAWTLNYRTTRSMTPTTGSMTPTNGNGVPRTNLPNHQKQLTTLDGPTTGSVTTLDGLRRMCDMQGDGTNEDAPRFRGRNKSSSAQPARPAPIEKPTRRFNTLPHALRGGDATKSAEITSDQERTNVEESQRPVFL